jgi:hypothetical protein
MDDYGTHDIEILAEINLAPRLTRAELLDQAADFAAQGADLIDLGCAPGEPWAGVGDAVRTLRDLGLRVSIDSFDPDPFALFDRMGVLDPTHAFYLGYEMMKARTALTLSKAYRQDQALEWGFLTEAEVSRRERLRLAARPNETEEGDPA